MGRRWHLHDAEAALRPLVQAAAARDGCTHAQAHARALRWLAGQLRLQHTPSSLQALSDPQLLLVIETCTRPLGLLWEQCEQCGQPALPRSTLQAQATALQCLRLEAASLRCVQCCRHPID